MRQSRLFTSSLRMTNPCCHNNSELIRKLKEVSATNFKQRLRTNSQQHVFAYCQR